MIDQDNDGWVTEADLKTMLASLGTTQPPRIRLLDEAHVRLPLTFRPSPDPIAPQLPPLLPSRFRPLAFPEFFRLQPRHQLHHILDAHVGEAARARPGGRALGGVCVF